MDWRGVAKRAWCFLVYPWTVWQICLIRCRGTLHRLSVWRNMRSSKGKCMLRSVILSWSATFWLERWCIVCWILLTALLKATWTGMNVYRDTTFRLHGYGRVILLRSSSCIGGLVFIWWVLSCFLGELWCFEQGLEGSGKHPRDALWRSVDVW